jgi:hypothetical protein
MQGSKRVEWDESGGCGCFRLRSCGTGVGWGRVESEVPDGKVRLCCGMMNSVGVWDGCGGCCGDGISVGMGKWVCAGRR